MSIDFTMRKRDRPPAHYTFKVESFSMISKIVSDTQMANYKSSTFESGGYKWSLKVIPKGVGKNDGIFYIQLALWIDDWKTNSSKGKLYAKYTLPIRDQRNGKHEAITGQNTLLNHI
ncbi:hypothetical protein REPUB_Repub08aG0214300 [Reevesia pubescens]